MSRLNKLLNLARPCVLSMALPVVFLAGFLAAQCLLPSAARATISNRLQRVAVKQQKGFTRISFSLQNSPECSVTPLPGNRLRLIMQDTAGPLFKKFRSYSDPNIGGLTFLQRGNDLLATFQMTPGSGWRERHVDGIGNISLDVGAGLKNTPFPPARAGREKIMSGVSKLVQDFDPPLKTDIPFQATDRQILKTLFNDADQKVFMAAEGALYKGRLTEAEEAFSQMALRQDQARPLALYRLGETRYYLQQYPQALAAFREAEKLWPAFINFNPGVTFCYGDSIVRSGDLAAGRQLLANLITRLSDKKFAPTLLVRLGDIFARQGHDLEALALYRTVADNFSNNKAYLMAQLRFNDNSFLKVHPWGYSALSSSYQEISKKIGDFDLREEALFKHVLLESIHGEAQEAMQELLGFQRLFPRGVYSTVIRQIRESLVAQLYREGQWVKDSAALIRFVEEHQEYLAGCIEQRGFLQAVAAAYGEAGRPIELIKLFSYLTERQWAAAEAPYLYEEIADNADLLGDTALAAKTVRTFLRKYPKDPRSRLMLERLGGFEFADGNFQEVRQTLLWLLNKGESAKKTESYYNMGRALWVLRDYGQAAKAMDLFLESSPSRDSILLPDAYYVAASSRQLTGDRKGALRFLEAGLKLPANRRADEFLYKSGEINLEDGRKQVARSCFEQLVKKGKDPDWKKLAQQALDSLELQPPR